MWERSVVSWRAQILFCTLFLCGCGLSPAILNDTAINETAAAAEKAAEEAAKVQMATELLDSARDKERLNSTEQFLWRDASRDSNRTIENPEPGVNASDSFSDSNTSNRSVLPEIVPLVEESHSCRVEGYERAWFGPLGCKCKSACEDREIGDSGQTAPMCTTRSRCFGDHTGVCTSSAKTVTDNCHDTCSSCSPGRDSDGLPSKSACRSCVVGRGWLPEDEPNCALGNQQGSCVPYPTPKQQCRTLCSPRTLTTQHSVKVIKNNTDSNMTNTTDVSNLPTLACSKLCTVPHAMRLGSADAIVFCTVEKLVTCQQKPNGTGFDCNSQKTTKYVGYQGNDDFSHWQKPHSLNDNKILYMDNSNHTKRLKQDWEGIDTLIGGLKNTSMTTKVPAEGTAELIIHNALQKIREEDPSAMCLTHSLIT